MNMTRSRNRGLLLLTLAVAWLSAGGVMQASEVKIIANPSVSANDISAEELKGVFLRTKTVLNDGPVEPVLEKGGAAHEAFLKEVLGKTDAALGVYYRSLVFTGKASMPKSFASDAELAEYVAKTKGAIGYVAASFNAPGVKTLAIR